VAKTFNPFDAEQAHKRPARHGSPSKSRG